MICMIESTCPGDFVILAGWSGVGDSEMLISHRLTSLSPNPEFSPIRIQMWPGVVALQRRCVCFEVSVFTGRVLRPHSAL